MKQAEGQMKLFEQNGQVVVEYVLILVVLIFLASQTIKILVSRDPNPQNTGAIVKVWNITLNTIARDLSN